MLRRENFEVFYYFKTCCVFLKWAFTFSEVLSCILNVSSA
ncbi:hypothetical protein LEP1GSC086_4455 [Leptospira weilii str. LNT 1234]|nr:hypothetical protein LEP1GSC086_4455 [Leptospira weilii str. LNT 1234]